MNFNPVLVLPEIYFLVLAVVLMIQSLYGKDSEPPVQKWLPFGAWLGFVVSMAWFSSSVLTHHHHPVDLAAMHATTMFWGAYKIDLLSQFFKMVIAFGFTILVTNAARQPTLEDAKRADYYMLLTFSALGLLLLSSAAELITIFLALELSSYSLYATIPLRAKSKGAAEAGVKYILFGAAATALALYGLSYIIASQHTTYLAELAHKDWTFAGTPMGVVGLCLFLTAMFFKLALFPFHFWCPDVYQGASNETAAYVATLPKLGAVVVLIRLAALLKPGLEVTTLLGVLGALSMTFGNLSALAQTDIKRLLGFSSVAHAGYIMVGLVCGTAKGLGAAAFYSMAYLLMNLLCFWVVSRVAQDGRNLRLSDLNGLYKRAPALAFSLAAGAFALVGLPPTLGFMGKFFLISAAWEQGFYWLVIILVVNSAIAIYYYLSLVRHAYTEETVASETPAPDNGTFSVFGAGILAAIVLLLGIIPGPIFDLAVSAGENIFH